MRASLLRQVLQAEPCSSILLRPYRYAAVLRVWHSPSIGQAQLAVSANDFLQTDRHEYKKVVDLIETVQMSRGEVCFIELLWKP